ncbi:putative DNA binding domain-containing protein [Candidatus Woesearchaeota archaeon]|nr:putative DNA binding domain-containing protein [Candidatus Woesearchaeota archaeon]
MDEKQVLEIVKAGETQTTEFKRTASKDVGKTICAFANTSGGLLLIGAEDNGAIIGVPSQKLDEIQQHIYHSQQECNPPPVCSILPVNTENGKVLVVKVPKIGSGVCYYKNEIYVRVGTTDHKIAGPAIEDFLKKKQVLCFEDELSEANLADLDVEKIKQYIAKRNPAIPFEEGKLQSILCTLRVAVVNGEFHLKKSAVLLFAKEPTKFIPQHQVKPACFKGTIAANIIATITLSGTLIENINQSLQFITKNIKTAYKIEKLEREEIPEYPLIALREAVINAIVHRDYYSPAAIQVNIFDDRIEIANPGALPRELKVQDLPFLGLGIPRNPTLYRLLSDVNVVEGLGTGFPRMFNAMRNAGLPDPRPEDLGTIFKLTFYNKFPTVKGGLNERQQRAIGYIKEHKVITANKYVELYNISKPTAIADLAGLVKEGIVCKIGKGKATRYTFEKKSID